jgi:hypothetical protein
MIWSDIIDTKVWEKYLEHKDKQAEKLHGFEPQISQEDFKLWLSIKKEK